jgi:DNA-binding transcriptional LysR family regulator
MDIRQLEYVVVLAREKHLTRAGKTSNVTQPTLSERIRQLEQELGVSIVERGQRFHGLTPEGERVLTWAEAILGTRESLQDGVIPSALPMAAHITRAIQDRHPAIELTVLSQRSIDILRFLEEFRIDIGLTDLDNEPIEAIRSESVYTERYSLVVRSSHPLTDATSVTWVGAAKEPLCLLTPNNQNRRII